MSDFWWNCDIHVTCFWFTSERKMWESNFFQLDLKKKYGQSRGDQSVSQGDVPTVPASAGNSVRLPATVASSPHWGFSYGRQDIKNPQFPRGQITQGPGFLRTRYHPKAERLTFFCVRRTIGTAKGRSPHEGPGGLWRLGGFFGDYGRFKIATFFHAAVLVFSCQRRTSRSESGFAVTTCV